jgi:sugar phosphate permease
MSTPGNNQRDATRDVSVLYRQAFWRIVPLLMICYTISYLNRINIGFAKLQMSTTLGLTEEAFGIGAGIFFLGYFFFGLPSNLLMQRFGARRWIAFLLITWGIVSACFSLIRTSRELSVAGFILGSVEAGFYPGVIVYLASWFPSRQRAAIVALFMSAIPIAGIFGNPLSGWIMDRFSSVGHLFGWQWMFLIESAPAVLAGLVVFMTVDDGIGSATWMNPSEKEILEKAIRIDSDRSARVGSVAAAMRDRRVWLMCFIYFTFIVGQYGLTFWMPTLIHGTGVSKNANVGWLSAIPFLCAVVAMNVSGRSADAHRERRWHLIVPAMVGAIGFCVAASFSHNTMVSILALSIAAAGVLTCSPLFWSLPTSFLEGASAAAGVGMINSIGNLAGFASPVMIGHLRDATHSSRSGMYALAGFMVLGAIAVWKVPAKLVNR